MDTMSIGFPLLVTIIVIALAFDLSNGMHDAANSIATVVSTRVLKPQYAVVWAAFFNFIAFLFFGLHVANTIGKGIIDPTIADPQVVLGALGGAIAWNIITWWGGIPSSSSHALIGGLIGGALAKTGTASVLAWEGISKTVAGIVLSPLLGFIIAQLLMVIVSWLFVKATPFTVDRRFRHGQLFSAALYSLGHGGNDAQKTIGIIGILLFSQGYMGSEFHIPFWVVLICQAAMGLGTLMGGWRIVKTMGSKITDLKPMQGFCAEGAGAITLFLATYMGVPVSTTHTITGGIMGAGAARKTSSVRWGVARGIVWAWIITIPASAVIAAITYWISAPLFP
ncbi:anion permease [Azospirillum sp. sgz301742]